MCAPCRARKSPPRSPHAPCRVRSRKTGNLPPHMHRDEISKCPVKASFISVCDARKASRGDLEAKKSGRLKKRLPHRIGVMVALPRWEAVALKRLPCSRANGRSRTQHTRRYPARGLVAVVRCACFTSATGIRIRGCHRASEQRKRSGATRRPPVLNGSEDCQFHSGQRRVRYLRGEKEDEAGPEENGDE